MHVVCGEETEHQRTAIEAREMRETEHQRTAIEAREMRETEHQRTAIEARELRVVVSAPRHLSCV